MSHCYGAVAAKPVSPSLKRERSGAPISFGLAALLPRACHRHLGDRPHGLFLTPLIVGKRVSLSYRARDSHSIGYRQTMHPLLPLCLLYEAFISSGATELTAFNDFSSAPTHCYPGFGRGSLSWIQISIHIQIDWWLKVTAERWRNVCAVNPTFAQNLCSVGSWRPVAHNSSALVSCEGTMVKDDYSGLIYWLMSH